MLAVVGRFEGLRARGRSESGGIGQAADTCFPQAVVATGEPSPASTWVSFASAWGHPRRPASLVRASPGLPQKSRPARGGLRVCKTQTLVSRVPFAGRGAGLLRVTAAGSRQDHLIPFLCVLLLGPASTWTQGAGVPAAAGLVQWESDPSPQTPELQGQEATRGADSWTHGFFLLGTRYLSRHLVECPTPSLQLLGGAVHDLTSGSHSHGSMAVWHVCHKAVPWVKECSEDPMLGVGVGCFGEKGRKGKPIPGIRAYSC